MASGEHVGLLLQTEMLHDKQTVFGVCLNLVTNLLRNDISLSLFAPIPMTARTSINCVIRCRSFRGQRMRKRRHEPRIETSRRIVERSSDGSSGPLPRRALQVSCRGATA